MRRFIVPAGGCLLTLGILALAASAADEAPPGAIGLQREVVLQDHTPLSANTELVRWLMSLLAAAQVAQMLHQSSQHLIEQSLDLAGQRFTLYVPPRPPAGRLWPAGFRAAGRDSAGTRRAGAAGRLQPHGALSCRS